MAVHPVVSWIETTLGVAVLLFILCDFFLTVLYARIGSGILSYRLARHTWRSFKVLARLLPKRRQASFLSLCDPTILVLLVAFWGTGLTLGTALIVHPQLGKAIVATNGDTTTDFGTAMFAGGSSVAIVGASEFTPKTRLFHWLFFVNSLVGMSVMFLTTTYILQVYTALQHRNAFALKLHLATRLTGDAAEFVAGLGPGNRFEIGYSSLAEAAAELVHVKEAHHFYPVIFYFRFSSTFYSVSRFTLTVFDTVSLLKTTLDEETTAWLKNSGAVVQLWEAAMLLVLTLTDAFVPERIPSRPPPPSPENVAQWRERYFAAHAQLRKTGISTTTDIEAGAKAYVALRTEWDHHVFRLARYGAYTREEIEARTDPNADGERAPV